jgi:hypothetical protein
MKTGRQRHTFIQLDLQSELESPAMNFHVPSTDMNLEVTHAEVQKKCGRVQLMPEYRQRRKFNFLTSQTCDKE